MKKWHFLFLIIPTGLLIWAFIGNMDSPEFFTFSLMDIINIIISILVGIVIVLILYYFSNLNDKYKSLKLNSITIFEKMEHLLCDEIFTLQKMDFNNPMNTAQYLSAQRSFSNCINVVRKYEQRLVIKEELVYINTKFLELKTIADTCLNHRIITEENKSAVLNIVGRIKCKLMEITMKLYS